MSGHHVWGSKEYEVGHMNPTNLSQTVMLARKAHEGKEPFIERRVLGWGIEANSCKGKEDTTLEKVLMTGAEAGQDRMKIMLPTGDRSHTHYRKGATDYWPLFSLPEGGGTH